MSCSWLTPLLTGALCICLGALLQSYANSLILREKFKTLLLAPDLTVDSHGDIFEWPYHWHKDWEPACLEYIDDISDEFPSKDFWNYNNHFRHKEIQHGPADLFVFDIFQGGGPYPRNQLPLDFGDQIADWIVANHRGFVDRVIWNHYYWEPKNGWQEYTGPMGDFVDHVHVELDPARTSMWYFGIDPYTPM